jgi:protein O-mannosyl-transferase
MEHAGSPQEGPVFSPIANPEDRFDWLPVLHASLILILGLTAYSNTFRGEFVFDDFGNIMDNPQIRDLGNYLFRSSGYSQKPNRFIGLLTFALNYRLGGLNVTGYHAVNLAIHITNALLVYALVVTSFNTPVLKSCSLRGEARAVALVTAMLFVAHPIQTQAVSYVVQRFASLATTFYLATIIQYARLRLTMDAGRTGRTGIALAYCGVLVTAALGMKTKEIAFTIPLMAALYEGLFFEGRWRRRVLSLLPLLLTLGIIPATLLDLRGPVGDLLSDAADVTRLQTSLARLDYLRTEIAVSTIYVRLLILPIGQNIDHDYPVYSSFLAPRVLFAAVLLLSLAGIAAALLYGTRPGSRMRCDPGGRLVTFGIAWFFLSLSIESSVIPIVDVIFEHRVYLPSVGFFLAATTALAFATRRCASRKGGRALVIIGMSLAVALTMQTFRRNEVWATELSLWSDSVEKSPMKARPHNNLGQALGKAHREGEALPHLLAAVRIDPTDSRAINNLGRAYFALGRQAEAAEAYRKALLLDPSFPEPYFNLGRLHMRDPSRLEEAAAMFAKAIELRPTYAEAYGNLAAVWNDLGRPEEAVKLLIGAEPIVSQRPVAQYQLGLGYVALGDRGAAEQQVKILERLSPALAVRLRQDLAMSGAGREPER